MIARWQRMGLVAIAVWVLACFFWQWAASPQWAVACALAPVLGYALVLAVEVVLMHRVNRTDPAPRARRSELLRAWLSECGWGLRIFYWRQPLFHRREPDWLPQPPNGRRGVVLVHGFVCNRGFWLPWLVRLRARGHPFIALSMEPPLGAIGDWVPQLERAVRQMTEATGQPPVLLCHSMGGLVARAWLREAGGGAAPQQPARVHRIITLGTPHSGTWLARFSRTPSALQMRQGGVWLAQLAADETPAQPALMTCWYSPCDNVVFPASTATLAGAENRLAPGLAHVQLAFDEAVMAACLAEIAA